MLPASYHDGQVNHVVPNDHSSSPRRPSSGSGILSRLPFMRTSSDARSRPHIDQDDAAPTAVATSPSLHAVTQQHKTRRRRGSLRKAALLGRGAQRDRKDSRPLTIDISQAVAFKPETKPETAASLASNAPERDALGLKVSDFAPRSASNHQEVSPNSLEESDQVLASTTIDANQLQQQNARRDSYNSTTDEEDVLQMAQGSRPAPSSGSVSSGSESYFAARTVAPRRRSFQQAKSPLSYSGISTKTLPPPDSDWDYSETEWWGWVVLTVTWLVFVIGMGSCLNVWKWAWDVGKTPYAPPELEDDPTLPISGYYPALIILTGVMAWVWVVVAWVGMKYFRHAKISGD